MFSTSTIFGLLPFTPKKQLILPCEGGEITLYVVDGRVQLDSADTTTLNRTRGRVTLGVDFAGYGDRFDGGPIDVPPDLYQKSPLSIEYGHCEVVFRLIPCKGRGQTAEVVAISFDSCRTFYNNHLCTLPKEYEEQTESRVG